MIACPACGADRNVPCHGRQAFDFVCSKRLTAQPSILVRVAPLSRQWARMDLEEV